MQDERVVYILGQTKKKFSVYVIILALITIILKLVLNPGFNLFACMAEIVVLLSLIITHFTAPVEKEIDERVTTNINMHYNKAFNIILPLAVISYMLSVILIIKMNTSVLIAPNLFINTFLFMIFIGLIILVRKHRIYLNYKFLESKDYYYKVFRVIGIGLIVTIGLILLAYFLDSIIVGPNSFNTLLITLIVSYFTIFFQYFLYSIYEHNHYYESINIDNGKYPIVTKNMILFFSLYVFFSVIMMFRTIASNLYLINVNESNYQTLILIYYLYYQALFYKLLIMIVMVYSLKNSLVRLTNHSYPLIRSFIILTITLVIFTISHEIFSLISNFYLKRLHTSIIWINIFSYINMGFILVINILTLSILIVLFVYAKKFNFYKNRLLIIPVIITVFTYAVSLYHKDVKTIQEFSKFYLQKDSLKFILKLICFGVYYIIIIKYKNPYEVNTKSLDFNQ